MEQGSTGDRLEAVTQFTSALTSVHYYKLSTSQARLTKRGVTMDTATRSMGQEGT